LLKLIFRHVCLGMAASLIDNFISILTALIMHQVNNIHNSHLVRKTSISDILSGVLHSILIVDKGLKMTS